MRLPRHTACKVNGTPVCTLCEKHTEESCVNRWKPFCVWVFCRLMWLVHVTVCVYIIHWKCCWALRHGSSKENGKKRCHSSYLSASQRGGGRGRAPGGVPAYCKTLKVRRIREVHFFFNFFNREKEFAWLVTRQNKTFNSLARQVPNLAFMKSTGLFSRSLNKYPNLIKQVVMLTAFNSIQCHQRLQAASEGGESGQLNYANVCQFNESEAEN